MVVHAGRHWTRSYHGLGGSIAGLCHGTGWVWRVRRLLLGLVDEGHRLPMGERRGVRGGLSGQ